jgi:hypothetical protein
MFFRVHSHRCKAASLFILATMLASANAATLINDVYSVYTKMDGTEDTKESDEEKKDIFSVQTMIYNSNSNGDIRAAATALTFTTLDDGGFSYEAGDISLSSVRPGNWPTPSAITGPFGGADANVSGTVDVPDSPASLAKIWAGSQTIFTVTFELGVNEIKQANFLMNYTIEISNGNQNSASVDWDFSYTDQDNVKTALGISGGHELEDPTTNANTFNSEYQSITIDQAGTYTLNIIADVPYQEFKNAQKSVSATLDAVYFEVVTVPEPGSCLLLALGLGGCMFTRRRA